MRILYLPSWFPSAKNPYGGAFIKELVLDIEADDIEIDVAAFHYNYTSIERNTYTKEVLENNSVVHHFYGWVFPKINIHAQKSWIKTCINDLEEQVEVGLYDFIHAHDYVGSFVAHKISEKYNIPLISSLHHSDFIEQNIPQWRSQELENVFEKSETIICPSISMKELVENDYNIENVKVFPNYIDSSSIPPKETLEDIPQKFIAITSHEKVKNNLQLIEFAEKFNLQLDIYGDIEKVLIHKVKSTKNVRYLGQKEKTILLQSLKNYDAFISMSEIETFGISIVECLCAGLPGLVYNITGSLDYINDDNGLFIQDYDNPVKEFMQKYSRYNPAKIRQEIINKYDKNTVIPEYVKLYRTLYTRLCVV